MTTTAVFSSMTIVLDTLFTMFGSIVTTITGNPLLYVPVLIALLGALVMLSIGIVKKLGIRGVSSSGGRRRRRR